MRFFFFKQKTAYEMRISDWSSDVCSSDLPAHERARNSLDFDRWTLQPVAHERYDDGNWRQKIGASMFALHRGSFFGTGGVVLFMVTSFGMPLFAVTGWMLYLDRRRRKRVVREEIGRASCRDRAGQYGEISGVAG